MGTTAYGAAFVVDYIDFSKVVPATVANGGTKSAFGWHGHGNVLLYRILDGVLGMQQLKFTEQEQLMDFVLSVVHTPLSTCYTASWSSVYSIRKRPKALFAKFY